MYGIGHGGIESILIVGVSVLSTGIYAYFYPNVLSTTQLAQIASTPEWVVFAGVWERIFTIAFHIGMSILVLQSFREKQAWYLVVAIGAHFFLDFASIFATQFGIIQTEAIVAIFGAVAAWYTWTTWKQYKTAPEPAPATPENPSPASKV